MHMTSNVKVNIRMRRSKKTKINFLLQMTQLIQSPFSSNEIDFKLYHYMNPKIAY